MNNVRILLDLDEVLADFIGPAAELWGLTRSELLQHWEPGVWDMVPPMRKALERMRENGSKVDPPTNEMFWKVLDNEDLWSYLPRLPWFSSLLSVVDKITPDWHIITSPIQATSCYVGKVKWIKRHFGSSFDRFAITPHKEVFANPRAILIDDRDETVVKFERHGGKGIIFPTYHNSQHLRRHDPVEYVSRQLEQMIE